MEDKNKCKTAEEIVNAWDQYFKEVIKRLPLEAIVLETDSPYLTPEPYRGKKNSPKYVAITAKFVADLFAITQEEIATITNNNLNRVFQKLKDC